MKIFYNQFIVDQHFMKIYLSIILILFPLLLSAQKSDSTRSELLKEVIVSSQRISEKNAKTAASISVLSSKNLRNYQVRTTPEALMNSAGVFIQKSTHGAGSLFVRGLTGNQTLILIDGIRLNNSTFRYGPNQYLNTIDPFLWIELRFCEEAVRLRMVQMLWVERFNYLP